MDRDSLLFGLSLHLFVEILFTKPAENAIIKQERTGCVFSYFYPKRIT